MFRISILKLSVLMVFRSSSGNFNVPPMLMAFGITTVDAEQVISPELKYEGNKLYLIKHTPLANYMPDVDQLKANWNYVHEQIKAENIVSGYALGFGGLAEAVSDVIQESIYVLPAVYQRLWN